MPAITSSADPRYRALIGLLRTAETLWNASRILFARWALSPSQFNVLNLLHELPGGLSQIELSRALLMHRSNVTGLVDRLEARGLLARKPAPGDRRSYRVELTGAGRRLLKEMVPVYYKAVEGVWGGAPRRRVAQLRTTLDELGDHARRMAGELARPKRIQ